MSTRRHFEAISNSQDKNYGLVFALIVIPSYTIYDELYDMSTFK